MIESILSMANQMFHMWNTWQGFLLFWMEVIFCAFGYFMMTTDDIAADVRKRAEQGDRYQPSVTVGTIIGRLVVSIVPGVNIVAMLFSVAPYTFGNFFKWLNRVFSFPLVPRFASKDSQK